MTRSYTLENWDGRQSTSYTHRSPQATEETQTSTSQPPAAFSCANPELSGRIRALNNGIAFLVDVGRNDHHPEANHNRTILADASVEQRSTHSVVGEGDSLPGVFVNSSTVGFKNPVDALNTSPKQNDQYDTLPHPVSGTETRSLSLSHLVKPQVSASPALTVDATSIYSVDASGEEEDDEEVVILDHLSSRLSADPVEQKNRAQVTFQASLFTPPPSEPSYPSSPELPSPPVLLQKSRTRVVSSPLPRSPKLVMFHVLVPPLSRPKSDYVRLSSLVPLSVKKPRFNLAEGGLREALESAWQHNRNAGRSPEPYEDGVPSKKGRKQKQRRANISASSGSLAPRDRDSIFVRRPAGKRSRVAGDDESIARRKKRPRDVIDLTLDSCSEILEERKLAPIHPQEAESWLRINVADPVPYSALVYNIRFSQSVSFKGVDHLEWSNSELAEWLLPLRRRKALVDQFNELKTNEDEFSLGGTVAPVRDPFLEEISDMDSVVGQLAPSLDSEHSTLPLPTAQRLADETPVAYPKIDLAAKFRKRKIADRRVSAVLSPSASDGAIQATPLGNPLSMTPRPPNSSPTIRRSPIKSTFVINEDAVARTPDLPSAKALGKRRAVSPPPELRFRSDLASLLPSAHVTSPDRRIQLSSDETMDFFINYCPSPVVTRSPTHHDSAISTPVDNLPLAYRGLYSSPASTTNVLDGQQQPATMLYPLNTYPDATTDVGYFPDNFFSEQPVGSGPLGWSPITDCADSYLSYDTVDPSLLGGDLVPISEYSESLGPTVVTTTSDQQQETQRSHSASPAAASSTSSDSIPLRSTVVQKPVDIGDTIVVRHTKRQSTEMARSLPRRRTKRHIPEDMVPLSDVDFSSQPQSGNESTSSSDDSSAIVSRPSARRKTHPRPKMRSTPPADHPTGKVMVGGQAWPMQDQPAYCHQCRNRTLVLKLECPDCPKTYCVRCLTVRYPGDARALQMKRVGCPDCLEFCNCTSCCRKRGVKYISTKAAIESGNLSLLTQPRDFRETDDSSRFSSPSPVSITPSPPPDFSIPTTTGTYFGTIYGMDGARIGVTLTSVGDTKAPSVTPTIERKRVFIGKIQPSWALGANVKVVELDPVPRPKKVHRFRQPRMYVGKRAPLFYRSEHVARELADLSPLSSLEEDWDVHKDDDDDDSVCELGNEQPGCEMVIDPPFRPESLTDRDVMRAIGLSLGACGIQTT